MSFIKEEYPVLEFDDSINAMIDPFTYQKIYGKLPGDKLIISFFKEAINKLVEENKIKEYLIIPGENIIVIYKFIDEDIFLVHGSVGCPACGGILETLIGLGITKVMFCGGGGVLDKNIKVGELLLVEGAIRDDGLSYQYIPKGRIVESDKQVLEVMSNYFNRNNIPYIKGLVWTTDALYRETKARILTRKNEGAKIVEMEQSGCLAISKFRNIKYGAIIYGGDDVSQDEWDNRNRASKTGIRYSLILMLKDIVKEI